MASRIREADWKIFREVHRAALARFCNQILSEVTRLANDATTGSHERYLLVFELIKQRNADIAMIFDDFRRSTAQLQLAVKYSRGFLTSDEVARFSSEIQETLKSLSEICGSAGEKRRP